ncbi:MULTISPECIES: GntR family transcriptional regulator [unclassified Sinorhizobium]|uniref:GntR family transcriptional regulator n=1 Tax=unclassified Sinorhizobium TaxID=2613772 RepID=UPI003525868A
MTLDFRLAALSTDTHRSRQATIGGRVYEAVRNAIVQLQFSPGNLLSEADIAGQLGVSRQPVREAFIKLGEVGLVEIRPQRGTFVRLISIREVENARFIREAIEVAIVRKAAIQATEVDVTAMEVVIADQRSAARRGENTLFLRLDEVFHQAIAASADCEDAWRVLDGLKAQMDRVRYLSLPEATPSEVIIRQHAKILHSIKRRMPDEAEAAMRQHLTEILISLPKLAKEHSSYFTE